MLITQSVIMTPNIFGFLIALLINLKVSTVDNYIGALQLLAAGLCIGIGSIGPCIGLSLFAGAACKAIGVNRKSYSKILPFSFVCEGIIETPVIFSLLIALLILNVTVTATTHELQGIAFVAAAICMGLSTIGTGISAGRVGSAACNQIGSAPETYPIISKIGLLALAMIDTFAIYGFIIAIILIYAI
jgi:F0F1-type ATP synthase membrane subunit c/vacuolar-type H+-ATPase subunit K